MTEPPDPFRPPAEPSGAPQPAPTPPAAPPAGPTYGAPQYGAPPYGQPAPYGAPVAPSGRNGLGTAALVLGIVAILPCSWFLVVPGVLALVFGLVGRGRVKRREATNGGAATTGIVLGSLALVAGVLVWGFLLANVDAFQRFDDCTTLHRDDSSAQEQCMRDFMHDVFGTTSSPG